VSARGVVVVIVAVVVRVLEGDGGGLGFGGPLGRGLHSSPFQLNLSHF
jgi:hypothetical protein